MNPREESGGGEQRWDERPACGRGDCTRSALSFSKYCWEHLGDQGAYLAALRPRAATLEGFAGLNLAGVRLKDIAGPRTNFAGAHLRGADLAGGDFTGACFAGTDLMGASLRGATLADGDFEAAEAAFANFRGARLNHADLRGATCAEADFSEADLARAHAEETDFAGAAFRETNLAGAVFRRSSLHRADLSGAKMEGTRFENCDLGAADIRSADLYGALFRETDLGAAVLPPHLRVVNETWKHWGEGAEIYAEFKLNFRQFGRVQMAETALYRERVARRRLRLSDRNTWRPWAHLRNALEYCFLDFYYGYGTKPWRVGYGLTLAWFLFGLYYYLLPWFGRMNAGLVSYVAPGGNIPPIADLSWHSFQRCLYFSFLTLTKLGFSSYEPFGWAKVAAGLEGSFAIVSYIILLVTVARKIWR